MRAKTTIILWPRPLVSGEYTIRLRVTYRRISRYYSLGIQCQKKDWDTDYCRIKNPTHPGNKIIDAVLSRATMTNDNIFLSGQPFTFEGFEAVCFPTVPTKTDPHSTNICILLLLKQEADTYLSKNQVASSNVRKKLAAVIAAKYNDLSAEQMTHDWQNEFTNHLKRYAKKTQSLYIMALRSTIKKAQASGHWPLTWAWTTETKPTGIKPEKRAITIQQLRQIETISLPPGSTEDWARNLFMLSFYLRGMNIADMAELPKEAAQQDRIVYTRRKGKRHYSIPLPPAGAELIRKLSDHNGPYLLPFFLEVPKTEKERYDKRNNTSLKINLALRKIARKTGLPPGAKDISFYTARHTFATALYHKGVDIGIISAALGHSEPNTTAIYLKSFGDLAVDKAIDAALSI